MTIIRIGDQVKDSRGFRGVVACAWHMGTRDDIALVRYADGSEQYHDTLTLDVTRYETVSVDGETITGRVYHVRPNGWPCVETEAGRCASGPVELTPFDERDGFEGPDA